MRKPSNRRGAPQGLRVAIDDAGAGYASLHHITQLQPDLIKCDMSLTRGIDFDPVVQALMKSLIGFARETGSTILAEGIETGAELDCLRRLGIRLGQGYLFGRPAPLPQ